MGIFQSQKQLLLLKCLAASVFRDPLKPAYRVILLHGHNQSVMLQKFLTVANTSAGFKNFYGSLMANGKNKLTPVLPVMALRERLYLSGILHVCSKLKSQSECSPTVRPICWVVCSVLQHPMRLKWCLPALNLGCNSVCG